MVQGTWSVYAGFSWHLICLSLFFCKPIFQWTLNAPLNGFAGNHHDQVLFAYQPISQWFMIIARGLNTENNLNQLVLR